MGMIADELMQNDQAPGCESIPGLSPGQARLCHLYGDHMSAVAAGAKQTLTECKHQFQSRRWNCSLLDDVNVFGPVIVSGKWRRSSSFRTNNQLRNGIPRRGYVARLLLLASLGLFAEDVKKRPESVAGGWNDRRRVLCDSAPCLCGINMSEFLTVQ